MDEHDEYLKRLLDADQLELIEAAVVDKRVSSLMIAAAMVSGAVAMLAAQGFTSEEIDGVVEASVQAAKRERGH